MRKGEIDRFKARLVTKGFSQQPRIDVGENFALVVRWDIVRAVFATQLRTSGKCMIWMSKKHSLM